MLTVVIDTRIALHFLQSSVNTVPTSFGQTLGTSMISKSQEDGRPVLRLPEAENDRAVELRNGHAHISL